MRSLLLVLALMIKGNAAPLNLSSLILSALSSSGLMKGTQINLNIKKDNPKIVDTVSFDEIENLAEFKSGKLVMCR